MAYSDNGMTCCPPEDGESITCWPPDNNEIITCWPPDNGSVEEVKTAFAYLHLKQ